MRILTQQRVFLGVVAGVFVISAVWFGVVWASGGVWSQGSVVPAVLACVSAVSLAVAVPLVVIVWFLWRWFSY